MVSSKVREAVTETAKEWLRGAAIVLGIIAFFFAPIAVGLITSSVIWIIAGGAWFLVALLIAWFVGDVRERLEQEGKQRG